MVMPLNPLNAKPVGPWSCPRCHKSYSATYSPKNHAIVCSESLMAPTLPHG